MKRRNFLSGAALASAAVPLGMIPLANSCASDQGKKKSKASFTPEELGMPSFAKKAPDGRALKAGLIGCGSRGTGAAVQFLNAGNDLSIVTLGDIFEDRMATCRERLMDTHSNKVDDSKCFLGFDAFEKVLEQDIDVVLIATPTHFHPDQFKAAVAAGKHVFMEKPAAVDPVGIRKVLVAAKQAKAMGLTVVTGNQRRHQKDYWEAYMRVKNGMLGDILSANAHWNQGAWWNKYRRPEWSDMEYTIRNWFNVKWLSGDHILDQAVHNIDVVHWFTGWIPESAVGYGGRSRRLTGDIFDFFSVDYRYANNKQSLATARQIDGCDSNVSESVMGTDAILYTRPMRIENYQGEVLWQYDYDAEPVVGGHDQEHVHLVESIRKNQKIMLAEDIAISTLISIQGREAAYTGKKITWDEIMASDLRYGPTDYKLGPLPEYHEGVAPVPGKDPKDPI